MDAKELRTFSVSELQGRVKQWREELFQTKFKSQTSEAKDTTAAKKIRKDIARALTVLNQKGREEAKAPQDKAESRGSN